MTNEDFYKAEKLKREIKTHQDNISLLNKWNKEDGILLENAFRVDNGRLEYTKNEVEKIIELEKEIIKSIEEEFERL